MVDKLLPLLKTEEARCGREEFLRPSMLAMPWFNKLSRDGEGGKMESKKPSSKVNAFDGAAWTSVFVAGTGCMSTSSPGAWRLWRGGAWANGVVIPAELIWRVGMQYDTTRHYEWPASTSMRVKTG